MNKEGDAQSKILQTEIQKFLENLQKNELCLFDDDVLDIYKLNESVVIDEVDNDQMP